MAAVIPAQIRQVPDQRIIGNVSGAAGATQSLTQAQVRTLLGLDTAAYQPTGAFQPADSDLTAIAALSTTPFGRSFLTLADQAAARTYIGAGTSSFDGAYSSLSGIPSTFTPATHNQAWSTITGTPTTISGYGITNAYTKTEVDNLVAGLLDFKGSLDCSANPNYPAGSKGDAYYVSVAGKIGGASGKSVDVGDMIVASADNAGGSEASVGTSWFVLEHNLTGALVASNNLSDLANAATARGNLGLGTLATQNGTFSGTSSGTNTGDQTITLTGDVTGSGTGSFATTIANNAVTNAMLAGSIAISKLAITGTPDGTKFLRDDGTWAAASGGSGLTSLNGLTGSTQTFAVGTSGTDFAISSSGTAHTFNIPDASASARGLVTTGAQTFVGQKTFAQGTLTSSAPLTLAQTWNSGATTFTGLSVAVTDTASASASLLVNMTVGGSSVFSVRKDGFISRGTAFMSLGVDNPNTIYFGNPSTGVSSLFGFHQNTNAFLIRGNAAFAWSSGTNDAVASSPDLTLFRDAANTLALRNGTNAQTFNLSNTWTSSTSFEYGRFQWATNEFRVGTAVGSAGGTQRDTVLGTWNSAGTWSPRITVKTTGSFLQGGMDVGDTAYYDSSVALSVKSNRAWLFNMYDASVQLKFALTQSGTLSVYNIMSNSNSYESLQALWSSNEARIGTAVGSAGGTQRSLVLGTWNSAGTWTPTITMASTGVITVNTVGSGNATLILDNSGANSNARMYIGAGGVHGHNVVIDPRGASNWATITQSGASGLRLVSAGNFSFSGALGTSFAPAAQASGTVVDFTVTAAAHTGQTASTESSSVFFDFSATKTFAAGALTTQRAFRIQAPTYAFAAASTITTASTLSISGPPIAGTNATITNPYALNVESGISNFNGRVFITDGSSVIETTGWAGGSLLVTFAGGRTVALGGSGIRMALGYPITFCSDASLNSPDVFLYRDAAGTLAQRNGTNAQTFRVYNTFTSATNAEWYQESWVTNELRLGTAVGSAGGTGRSLVLGSWNSAGTWTAALTISAASSTVTCSGNITLASQVTFNSDSAIRRTGAGVIEVNSGTPGTLRDLCLRNFAVNSASVSAGGGVGIVFIANATTVPTTDPTGGGILYVEGGALKYRGSSGTVTTLAPA